MKFGDNAPLRLATAFQQQLGVELSEAARFRVAVMLLGFYRGALEYLQPIDVAA